MEYDHDVIVIGGGPAGSSFARVAASAGMDVLVVDKRKEIGVPVRCGEVVGVSEIIGSELELPKRCYSSVIQGIKILAPDGKSVVWRKENDGWVVERKIFDKWLCELAVEEGAKTRTYTRATGLIKEDGKIRGVKLSYAGKEDYEARAPLIISAEGMESMMAREAGFKTVHMLQDVGSCYEYEMKPVEHENLMELYVGRYIAPGGYVWVFPKGNRKANVGIGIGGHLTSWKKNGGIMGADPKKVLEDFIKEHERFGDASPLTEFGGVISIGAPINEFVKDNFMVIGTAAKQVDPIHGGGINIAINAGVLAAKTAIRAHEKKDYGRQILYEYEKTWRETEGKICEQRLKLQKALAKLDDDDLNHIISSIKPEDFENAMGGKFAGAIAKIVAGRPQLFKILGALK